ncbi:MAG: hypothetical protein O2794_00090 [bacterium]|nr:hypothetical protein [bacterium]
MKRLFLKQSGFTQHPFFKKNGAGFTIVELVVVLGVFVTSMVALFGVAQLSFRAVKKAGEKTQAAFLLEEAYEGIRYARDTDYSDKIADLSIFYDQCFRFDGVDRYNFTQDSLALQYHMDESTGTLIDTSGNNNNATCSTCPDSVQGETSPNLQNAKDFGAGHYYTSGSNAPDLGTNATISIWVRGPIPSDLNRLIMISGFGYWLTFDNQIPTFKDVLVTLIDADDPILDFDWHHIVLTYDGSWLRLYKDGALAASPVAHTAAISQSGPLSIGNPNPALDLNGTALDELAIYTRALTENEVVALYNSNRPVCGKLDNKYTRIVRVKNVCRNTIGGAKSNILGGYAVQTDVGCKASTSNEDSEIDLDTKYFEVDIIWGADNEFIETLEFYISNLFLDSDSS